MTPMPLITGKVGISHDEATALLRQHKRERLPLIDDQGRLRGLITVKDFVKSEQFPPHPRTVTGDCSSVRRSATSVRPGSGPPRSSRPVSTCSSSTPRTVTRLLLEMVERIKSDPATRHTQVIGGNIATRAGAQALIDAGVDAVKVGVGPGSICTTRIVAGVGVPQVTAIHNASLACRPAGVPLIGDGGLQVLRRHRQSARCRRRHGHGRIAARGLRRVAGELVFINGKQFKAYRGMGSLGRCPRGARSPTQGPLLPGRRLQRRQDRARGIEGQVAYRGPVGAVTHQLIGVCTIDVLCRRTHDPRSAGSWPIRADHGCWSARVAPHDISGIVEAPNYTVKP